MAPRFLLPLFALVACTPDEGPEALEEGDLSRSPLDGTPQGIGLLAFLNDRGTTLTVLDVTVDLDVRAARNLIAHRDGGDRIFGTRDDNRFDGIEEVDAVAWVGPSTLDQMFAYVAATGWIPEGEDVLGTWDG